jgi:hypothetical protein
MAGFRFSVYTLRSTDYDLVASPTPEMFMRLTSLIAVLVLAVVACRSDNNNNTVDGNGSGSGSGVTIQQVQSDAMAAGTAVSLNNVVITAIDNFGAKTGDIWVEEMGGGKRSGVHVYKGTAYSGMAVGDVINLTGSIKAEFSLTGSNADPSGRTETELEPPTSTGTVTLTKVSSGATITPDKVDALAIGQMYDSTMSATGGGSAFSNAWEDWEGVLIELDNVAAASAPKGFGSTPYAADAYAFSITGVAKTEGSLTDITASSIARSTCFSNMTGVVSYFYDYLVYPRSSSDFATGGTGCPAAEQANGTDGSKCTDGIDNDANGFADCQDLGCETGSGAWLGASCTAGGGATCGCSANLASTTSVATVNSTYATTSAAVVMRDVYITAINGTNSYWVSDSLAAGANKGVYVFSAPPAGAVVGQKLATLQGIVGPYKPGTLGVTEVSNATAGTLSGAATAITPITGIATDTLTGTTAGASYAGSLVTLTVKAKVTTAANSFGEVVFTDANGKTITMDDDAFQYYGGTKLVPTPPAINACLTITGVMDVNTTDNIRTINPRSAADLVTATGC